MPRNRIISQVEALYASSSPATGTGLSITQVQRVQSVAHNWSVARVNVNQFGQLSPMSREINESPTATVDFSYYLVNVLNEQVLGFVTDGSASMISGLISRTTDEKNYYLVEAPEGEDINYYGTGANRVTYGIGNGFMSSYSTEAAVNGFPTSTVRVEGLNAVAYAAASGQTPAVDPVNGLRLVGAGYNFVIPAAATGVGVPVLKHGDITLDLGADVIGVDIDDIKIQRYTLSFNMRRTPQLKLGSRFAFSREIEFPVDVTLSVDANLGDIATGSVSDLLCNDIPYTLNIYLREPACTGVGTVAAHFTLYGAKLDSVNTNSTIGPNKTVTMQWTSSLGGPSDTGVGLFLSGIIS
jgi:hypothetical protein